MEKFDIVIIGGGPAGSAFAANISGSKFKVLLVENRRLDMAYKQGMQKKPCTGLISLPAQEVLARLNLAVPDEIKVGPSIVNLKIIDYDTKREISSNQKIINIQRQGFDRWLFQNIPGNISVRTGAKYIDHYSANGRTIVRLVYDKAILEVSTKLLVGADGANSKVRDFVHPFKSAERYVGTEWVLRLDEKFLDPYFRIILHPKLTDYYLWTVPKDGFLHVGGAFSRYYGGSQKYASFVKSLQDISLLPVDYKILSTWSHYIVRPIMAEYIFDGDGLICFIGEAAGLICPISAEGYSYALQSGFELADYLNRNFPYVLNNEYIRQFKVMRRRIWIQNVKRDVISEKLLKNAIFKTVGSKLPL